MKLCEHALRQLPGFAGHKCTDGPPVASYEGTPVMKVYTGAFFSFIGGGCVQSAQIPALNGLKEIIFEYEPGLVIRERFPFSKEHELLAVSNGP